MLVEFKKANICQAEGENVLENVDFCVNEGDFIYLIGRVGSGKSSLLKTIYCELDIDEAEKAEVIGNNLLEIRRKEIPALRKQMGIVFQDFQLLTDRNVYKNLRFVLRSTGWKDKQEIDERIREVLQDVKMEDKADKMPHELSGGEQQRVCIARAIVKDPMIILADEPTAALDFVTGQGVLKVIEKIVRERGKTVIMVTHNVEIAKMADRVIKLKNGKIASVRINHHPLHAEDLSW